MKQRREFTSERRHSRIDFTPLRWSCKLACKTPLSPPAQVANSILGEYEPNREGVAGTPTIIRPETRVVDEDGVWSKGCINSQLSSEAHEWFVNGVPVADVWSASEYEIISDSTDDNGSIKVKKNIEPGTSCILQYKGSFNDFRTGTNYEVESDTMALSTTDKGGDKIDCSVDTERVVYDPLQDRLLLYEYLVAKGLLPAGNRANYIDAQSYERTVTVQLTVGQTSITTLQLPTGITMRLCIRGTNTPVTAGDVVANAEVLSIVYPQIKFDMRFVDEKEYEVQFLKAGTVIASHGITLAREMSCIERPQTSTGADIIVGQVMRRDSCIISLPDRVIEYPECYFLIDWYTQARKWDAQQNTYTWADPVKRNTGERMEVEVADLGIGMTKNLSQFSTYVEVAEDEPLKLLTDEESDYLTDEDGNYLTTN